MVSSWCIVFDALPCLEMVEIAILDRSSFFYASTLSVVKNVIIHYKSVACFEKSSSRFIIFKFNLE
jgi:hypothetical protein